MFCHSAGGGGSRSQSLPCAAAVRVRVQGCVFQHSYRGHFGRPSEDSPLAVRSVSVCLSVLESPRCVCDPQLQAAPATHHLAFPQTPKPPLSPCRCAQWWSQRPGSRHPNVTYNIPYSHREWWFRALFPAVFVKQLQKAAVGGGRCTPRPGSVPAVVGLPRL